MSRLLGAAAGRGRSSRNTRRETGVAGVDDLVADARLVDRVERQVAGAVGSASARVMIASVAQEEPLAVDDVIEIVRRPRSSAVYARALRRSRLA